MVQILNSGSNKIASARMRRKSEARRLDILRAAARVFRRSGVAAAGMREIAEEADLSPGNLYYYFAGKDELLFFCQDRTLDRMLEAAEAARACAIPAADQLRAVIRAHLHYTLDELEGATAHLEIDMLADELRRTIIEKRDKYEHAVRALIVKGVKRGEFVPCDAALVARAILGALNWTARWYRPDGLQSVAAIAEGLADYLVRGIAAARKDGVNKGAKETRGTVSFAPGPVVPQGDFPLKGDRNLRGVKPPNQRKLLSAHALEQSFPNTMTAPARAISGGRK
jgi:AcrR family transcriptional regulator